MLLLSFNYLYNVTNEPVALGNLCDVRLALSRVMQQRNLIEFIELLVQSELKIDAIDVEELKSDCCNTLEYINTYVNTNKSNMSSTATKSSENEIQVRKLI